MRSSFSSFLLYLAAFAPSLASEEAKTLSQAESVDSLHEQLQGLGADGDILVHI